MIVIGSIIIATAILCHPRGFWEAVGLIVMVTAMVPVMTTAYCVSRWILDKVGL